METEARNRNILIDGATDIMPLVNTILRVLVVSYIELARANKAEDASPCAIIIVSLPMVLHVEVSISLLKRRPMWLTEA